MRSELVERALSNAAATTRIEPNAIWHSDRGSVYTSASFRALVTGLGMIAGQLLGSLALDLALPAPGTVVAPATILGTLLTLAAIILATLPWPRGALRRQRPVR